VFGLDVVATAVALGVAGSQAAGSMEFLADGAWTKRFHPGWAASAGLHAAALARAGFRAPASILDGRFGFLHAYGDGADPAALRAGDGFELKRTGVKPHACCRYSQGPIDAVLALRAAHAIDARRVGRVDVGIVAPGFAIVCEPLAAKRRPRSTVDAQFSLPFSIAVALVRGAAWPEEFAPSHFDDPAVRHVMDRVHPVRDAALDAAFPRTWPSWVRITFDDGTTVERAVTHPLGDPENFPDAGRLREMFVRLASRSLPAGLIDRLADAVGRVGEAADLTPLLELVRGK
jgi:2-methylcitrate dehydratase PrpD